MLVTTFSLGAETVLSKDGSWKKMQLPAQLRLNHMLIG